VSFRVFCCPNEELIERLRVLIRWEAAVVVVMVPGIETPRPVTVSFEGRAGVAFDPHRTREEAVVEDVVFADDGSCGDAVIFVDGVDGVVNCGKVGVRGSEPFEVLLLLSARTVEPDEVDVDSRTESSPMSLVTLAVLPVLFFVTGGRRGLELIVRSIAAGPGEWDEADVGVDEWLNGESVYLVEGLLSQAAPKESRETGRSCVNNRGTFPDPDRWRTWRREDVDDAEVDGKVMPRTDVCEVFLEAKCDDPEVDRDVVEPFPSVYPLSELAAEFFFFTTLRTFFSASDDTPDDPTDVLEKTRWSLVGGPVRGRCMGVVERSTGVGSWLGRLSLRVNIEVSASRGVLLGFVVRGTETSVRERLKAGGYRCWGDVTTVDWVAVERSFVEDGFGLNRGAKCCSPTARLPCICVDWWAMLILATVRCHRASS
jgi:hypothetical protein